DRVLVGEDAVADRIPADVGQIELHQVDAGLLLDEVGGRRHEVGQDLRLLLQEHLRAALDGNVDLAHLRAVDAVAGGETRPQAAERFARRQHHRRALEILGRAYRGIRIGEEELRTLLQHDRGHLEGHVLAAREQVAGAAGVAEGVLFLGHRLHGGRAALALADVHVEAVLVEDPGLLAEQEESILALHHPAQSYGDLLLGGWGSRRGRRRLRCRLGGRRSRRGAGCRGALRRRGGGSRPGRRRAGGEDEERYYERCYPSPHRWLS